MASRALLLAACLAALLASCSAQRPKCPTTCSQNQATWGQPVNPTTLAVSQNFGYASKGGVENSTACVSFCGDYVKSGAAFYEFTSAGPALYRNQGLCNCFRACSNRIYLPFGPFANVEGGKLSAC